MTRPATLARTLWYWRPEQWRAAARRRLSPTDGRRYAARGTPHLATPKSAVPWLPAPRALVRAPVGETAGGDPALQRRFAWSDRGAGRLALDQLHAFAWILGPGLDADARLHALVDWISFHSDGVGWEPAPTSRRILSWLKCLTTPGALPRATETHGRVLPSLADQLTHLEHHLEIERGSERLLWNLLALTTAATLLEGEGVERWAAFAPQLAHELERQIGADGAHESRCPMVHAELLEGLLDLLNAMRSAGAPESPQLAAKAAAMLGAHAVWTHPDGEIALLGDSAFGVAHTLGRLTQHAEALGVKAEGPGTEGVLDVARIVRLERDPFVVLFTAGPPAPAWQPVHAHCDALSFELSLGDERVVTDTGVFDFGEGPWRDRARATRSHATAVVNEAEQAELWGADRVGGRPDAGIAQVEPGVRVEGVCAGWSTPEVLHRRLLRFDAGALRIEDRFDRAADRAELVLPLAPAAEVRLDGTTAHVTLRNGQRVRMALPESARWHVERGPCFIELGSEGERSVLVGEARKLTAADWVITPEERNG